MAAQGTKVRAADQHAQRQRPRRAKTPDSLLTLNVLQARLPLRYMAGRFVLCIRGESIMRGWAVCRERGRGHGNTQAGKGRVQG